VERESEANSLNLVGLLERLSRDTGWLRGRWVDRARYRRCPRLARLPGGEEDHETVWPVRVWIRMKDGRDWIVYSVSTGDTWKLFRIETSRLGEVSTETEQLASGTGILGLGGALSEDGKLAYVALTLGESIYQVPTNDRGQNLGPTLQLLFSEEGRYGTPSVSRDGHWMEYGAFILGKPKVVMLRDLWTGLIASSMTRLTTAIAEPHLSRRMGEWLRLVATAKKANGRAAANHSPAAS
jgi:hypothetical protein